MPVVTAKAGAAVLPGSSTNDMGIGVLGILHPSVLANFEIPVPRLGAGLRAGFVQEGSCCGL